MFEYLKMEWWRIFPLAPPTKRKLFAVYGTLAVKSMAVGRGVPERKVVQKLYISPQVK